MKIGMQTWGSHGDIRPFLALAEGLQAAGHEVSLVLTCVDSAAYAQVASTQGVKITVLASPVLTQEQSDQLGMAAIKAIDPMRQIADLLRASFDPVEDAMFEAAQTLSAESDLLIGHYFLHPLSIAAEQAGRPYVSVLLSHAGVPSAFSHPLGLFGAWKPGNRLLWWLTRLALNRTLKHYPDRLRRLAGLPATRDIVTQVWMSPHLTLVGVSPQICERQQDWEASVQVIGFLDMPNMALEGTLPDTLSAFLAAGEPPVYMTLGSWMPKDLPNQALTLKLLTEAATLAGCRAIIQSMCAGDCGFLSSEQVLYVPAAPHHAIFPHCELVVHHGGAGTTQAATLAGKPSVVVAHISEQEHWGAELRRMGIGGKPAKRRQATAASLAQQIRVVRNAPAMRAAAQAVALPMRAENGVAEAVKLIGQRFAGEGRA